MYVHPKYIGGIHVKKPILSIAVLTLIVLTRGPLVLAMPDPFATLRVVPVGSVETGEPIVTQSPATLMIYVTDEAKQPLDPAWLLLAINEETYIHLGEIFTNTSLIFTKSDFTNVTETGETKIPPENPSGSYPGCEQDEQYEVSAIKAKLGIPADGDLFYAYKELTGPYVSPVTTNPQYFEVTVDTPGNTNMKVLVLALGYWAGAPNAAGKLNVHSPFSGSTLVVLELSTFLLALAPLSAFGLYKIRYKIRKK
jgi:hypothetical protein